MGARPLFAAMVAPVFTKPVPEQWYNSACTSAELCRMPSVKGRRPVSDPGRTYSGEDDARICFRTPPVT
jgi:hypothetical protein